MKKLSLKLVKTNAMLCKIRYFVNKITVRFIYFDISHSCILQEKALRVITYAGVIAHINPLFFKLKLQPLN